MTSKSPLIERNKQIVQGFVTTIMNEGNPRKAAELYMDETYIQHEFGVADGKQAFIHAIETYFLSQQNQQSITIRRMIAEDDLVAVHFHLKLSAQDVGMQAIDMFRITAAGRICEHWTVHMPIPADAGALEKIF